MTVHALPQSESLVGNINWISRHKQEPGNVWVEKMRPTKLNSQIKYMNEQSFLCIEKSFLKR